MASNSREEPRMDYYEFKRKHEEWLKTFADVRRTVEDSQQKPAPTPSRQQPPGNAGGSETPDSAAMDLEDALNNAPEPEPPKAAAQVDISGRRESVSPIDAEPLAASPALEASEGEDEPSVRKAEPSAPEIPDIFIRDEKELFNTGPIEKATDEFLAEENPDDDEREPNPFDSLFRVASLVKDKFLSIRNRRRAREEEDDEDYDTEDVAPYRAATSSLNAKEISNALNSPSGSREAASLSQTQELKARYGRPEKDDLPHDIPQARSENSANSVKSEGGHTMPEQNQKNPAELSQLLAEGLSDSTSTLSRRERRMIEQKSDPEEAPTQVYKPVRDINAPSGSSRTVEYDEEEEEEEEIRPKKQKASKKAPKISQKKVVEEDDFDDFDNFDDFDEDSADKEPPALRGKGARKSSKREYDDEDDYDEDEKYEDDEDYEDEDYEDDEDDEDFGIGKRILSVLKGVLIAVLILALLFVALRLLEGQGIIRLTGLRGVINSISPEAAQWLLPEPSSVDDLDANLPALDNDGFNDTLSEPDVNFDSENDATGDNSADGNLSGNDLFVTASPTAAPTQAPTASPSPSPTTVPFDDSQLGADDIFNALP